MIRSIFLGLVVLSAAPLAHGALVTFEFSGVIDTVGDAHDLLEGAVQPGDTFSGSYTFDSDTPDSGLEDPDIGLYRFTGSSMVLWLADLEFPPAGGTFNVISVADFDVSDRFMMESYDYESAGFFISQSHVRLEDPTASAFESDALPTSPPLLGDFSSREFFWSAYVDDPDFPFGVTGTVTSLTPEPQALVLLLVGWVSALRRL